MTIEQIQAKLDRLLPMVLAKNIAEPCLEYRMRAAEVPLVNLNWYIGNSFQSKSWTTIAAFVEWLNALPTPEAAALRTHNDRIASVIDKAREAGIADEYVTPLVAVRTAISTNLLGAA